MAKCREIDELRSLVAETTREEPLFMFVVVCRNGTPGHPDNCSYYEDRFYIASPYSREDLLCEGCHERMLPLHGEILIDEETTPLKSPGGDALHDGLHPQEKREIESRSIAGATDGYCHRADCCGLVEGDMASLILNRSHAYCSPRCTKEAIEGLDEKITEVCLHATQGETNRKGIRLDRQNATNIWRYVVNNQEALSAIDDFQERLQGPFREVPDDELREINKNRDL